MQIRRNENVLFPNVKSNIFDNDKKFFMAGKNVKEDVSATMTISKSGCERARMLREDSKDDDYMKTAESKIDKILDTVRTGGVLSKEEEELINHELKSMSEQKYKEYKDLRLKPEDVLTALKENYMRRERLFFELQEQMEVDFANQQAEVDNVKIMTYMQEKENEEELVEMLEDCAEDEGEETNTESEEIDEKEIGEQEINLSVGEEPVSEFESEDANLPKQALKMMESIETEFDSVQDARNESAKKETSFAKGLEDDYKRMQQVLDNDEISVEDKVKAYDRFVEEARVNASNREIERIKKQFDAETLMMARIMMLGKNPMDDAINGNDNISQLGTDFIKSFLI